jgi:molybdate transport system substrate-binding protein
LLHIARHRIHHGKGTNWHSMRMTINRSPSFPFRLARFRGCASLAIASVVGARLLVAGDVRVAAAASLTDALKEIASAHEKNSGDRVVFSFAASSLLARQIEQGAPFDVFLSADEAKMNLLEKRGLIDTSTRKVFLSNRLVVVTPRDQSVTLTSAKDLSLPAVKRIALAEPRSVPAGIYAKEYLEKAGVWSAIEKKVVPTENVRAALAAIEAGNAEAAIVYKTDAAISRRVRVAFEVTASEGPQISYVAAQVKEAKDVAAARRFLAHLSGPAASEVWKKFGFIVPSQ